jgi:predicted NAD/FAD-binding protein
VVEKNMKIAIIGSGISGLTSAYYLNKNHDITVFEANDYIGGHTATVDVAFQGNQYAVDTGFIVYNDRTYPNFIKLLEQIGVEGTPTEMSFSIRNDDSGLEYNGHTISTLFAQKRNLLRPSFYRFIFEILRFNKLAKANAETQMSTHTTLGDFLTEHQFSEYFCQNYILPMGAAIWSSTLADMRCFPLSFFLRFFLNHGLLDVVDRPQWYVVNGGSRAYIDPLTKEFSDRIRLSTPVSKVTRHESGVVVEANDQEYWFDQVIFACHSDQALKLLDTPTQQEQEVLANMAYQSNEVILHTDTSLLPKRKAAWASWNYYLDGSSTEQQRLPALTYNMNILQHIKADATFCVSLNSSERINENKILKVFHYSHPVFSTSSLASQKRKSEVSGHNHTWYCGAYWHNGFHEDGVKSALEVVEGIERLASTNPIATKGAA